MHAYLIVGRGEEKVEAKVERLAKKLKAKIFPFSLTKINDVRELGNFTKLTIGAPTAIYIKGIDKATIPALNAFLKNLEEPQPNLFYILTAENVHSILPTIISRCQVIKMGAGEPVANDKTKAQKFLQMDKVKKLSFISQIRARDEAINFTEGFILGTHSLLIKAGQGHARISQSIKAANFTLAALRANGNVQLQLTNFVLSLV